LEDPLFTQLRDQAGGRTDDDLFPEPFDRIIDLAVEPEELAKHVKVPSRRWLELGWRSLRVVQPK